MRTSETLRGYGSTSWRRRRTTSTAIGQRFDLHPLAIEDSCHSQRRAKVDVYPSGLFLVWITPVRRDGDTVTSSELDVFIGRGYLVTLHAEPSKAIRERGGRYAEDAQGRA